VEPLPPETLVALTVTAAVGVLMARIGLRKGLLSRRTAQERCATCGHRVRGNGCANCRRAA
jgi:hypothetical protein